MSAADHSSAPPAGRSWRDIRQEISPPATSRRGRRRRLVAGLKVTLYSSLTVAAAWGGMVLVHEWQTDRAALTSAVHSDPVRDLVLITDGVLTKEWAAGVLALPKATTLMALQLPGLRDRLLQHGQVRVAVLTRSFPDTLVVTLHERTPVARVQASEGGAPRQLLVAKDGIVYDGLNYDPKMVASLPWLDGIRLVRAASGYQAIDGMADVAALLSTAQLQAPHLYREWRVVSLARLAEAGEVIVKASDVPEIIFSRKRDWFKQVAQLDYVLDRALLLPEPGLKSVNLAFEGQVPVQLAHPPAELVRAAAPNLSLPPSQLKLQRDL